MKCVLARLFRFVVAIAFVVALGAAVAQDGGASMPFNPFADAKAGDWSAFVIELRASGKPERSTLTLSVTSVVADDVNVAAAANGQPPRGRRFSRVRTPTFEEFPPKFAKRPGETIVAPPKWEDATRLVQGRSFSCKKVSFTVRGTDSTEGTFSAWFCSEIKASGLVALEIVSNTTSLTWVVAGFGTADGVAWGTRAEDLDVADGVNKRASAASPDPTLPMNPFSDAKVGDWSTFLCESRRGESAPEWSATVWRVTKIEGDAVTVVTETCSAPGVAAGTKTEVVFSRTAAPSLLTYLALPPGLKIVGQPRVSDGVRMARRGRQFVCKVVVIEATLNDGKSTLTAETWLSPDVKGSGLAHLSGSVTSPDPRGNWTMRWTVAGFGAGGVTWGSRFEDIDVTGARLPWNPLARAKEGDWSTYRVEMAAKRGSKAVQFAERWSVVRVEGSAVTIQVDRRTASGPGESRSFVFSTASPCTVDDVLELSANDRAEKASVEDAHATKVGGREFSGKKISCKTSEGGSVTLWLSPDVPARGVVRLDLETREGDADVTVHCELAGFGTKEGVSWGTRLEAVDLGQAPDVCSCGARLATSARFCESCGKARR